MYNSKKDLRREDIKVGDKVMPVASAGVCLSTMPVTGKFKQNLKTSCTFKGVGIIRQLCPIVIDYETWDDFSYIGKLKYVNCLIECKDGIGWASVCALRKVEDDEGIQKGFAQTQPRRCSSRSNKVRRRALERRSRARNHHWQ